MLKRNHRRDVPGAGKFCYYQRQRKAKDGPASEESCKVVAGGRAATMPYVSVMSDSGEDPVRSRRTTLDRDDSLVSSTSPRPKPGPVMRRFSSASPVQTGSAHLNGALAQLSSSLGQKVSGVDIRDLNELIRKRYALDVEIWSKRYCMARDRKVIEDKMRRSDAALARIMSIVRSWDRPEVWESDADWQRLRTIRDRLEEEGGKRIWKNNPPWDP